MVENWHQPEIKTRTGLKEKQSPNFKRLDSLHYYLRHPSWCHCRHQWTANPREPLPRDSQSCRKNYQGSRNNSLQHSPLAWNQDFVLRQQVRFQCQNPRNIPKPAGQKQKEHRYSRSVCFLSHFRRSATRCWNFKNWRSRVQRSECGKSRKKHTSYSG